MFLEDLECKNHIPNEEYNHREVKLYNTVSRRNLFISNHFRKDIKKINEKLLRKDIEKVLEELTYLLDKEPNKVSEYLLKKRGKKFKGIDILRKFYMTDSHRIIYAYGKDIGKYKYNDSIFILRYVTNHDMQGKVAINTQTYDDDVFYVKDILNIEETIDEKSLDREIIYYVTANNLKKIIDDEYDSGEVLLNSEQEKWDNKFNSRLNILVVKGNAGSGKTTVSLNIMKEIDKYDAKSIYLTFSDELKNSVVNEYKKWGYKKCEGFYSIHKYYLSVLGLNESNYISYNKFLNWYQENCYAYRYSPFEVWAEIRGLIKGYMLKEWDRDINKGELVEYKYYNSITDIYSKFSEGERRDIYSITEKYNSWLKMNNYYDDNDLAREVIKKVHLRSELRVEAIVVDEVQDLTDMQIESIFHLTNNNNIYFCGDQNQIINPTLFSFSRLNQGIYKKNNELANSITLKNNYRSIASIIDYINSVTDLRMKYIGNQKYEDDEYEVAIRKESSNNRVKQFECSKENIKNVIDIFEDIPSAAIIVATDSEKEKMEREFSTTSYKIFTVREIKGLEFKHVVCYNLISCLKEKWQDIFEYNGRRNTNYRYYFNLFYVAITRAREFLFFVEEDLDDKISNNLFNMPMFHKVDDDTLEIDWGVSPEEWFKEGEKFEKVEDYVRAIKSYSKYENIIGDSEGFNSNRCRGKIEYKNGNYSLAGECFLNTLEYERALECFELIDDKEKILEVLLKCESKDSDRIRELMGTTKINQYLLNLIVEKQIVPIIKEHKENCDLISEIAITELVEVCNG